MEANWDANIITLHWYSEDNEIQNVPSTSQSCTYDGSLTPLPVSNVPTRTGYTFKGWRAKSCFNNYSCGLNSSLANTNSLWYASKSSAGLCIYHNENTYDESNNCSDSHITGLNNGEWKVDVSHGVLKGISMCNNVPSNTWETTFEGIMNGTITTITTEEQLIGFIYNSCTSDAVKPGNAFNNAGTGQYCWCKMTSYTPINGSECNTSSSAWMVVYMDGGHDNTNDCIQYCPSDCANIVSEYSLIRNVIFGATGNQ